MTTLINFIKNVEDEVFEKVLYYTEHQENLDMWTDIWVHQIKGKIVFDDYPKRPGYVRISVYKLCGLDQNLRHIPDKKAIKRWIENEVLMHAS